MNFFPYQAILNKKNCSKEKVVFVSKLRRGREGPFDFVVRTTQNYHFFDVAPKEIQKDLLMQTLYATD